MIPRRIEECLVEMKEYVVTNDWLIVKKELVKQLPSDLRSMFSKRHPISKKQMTNDFEREVAARWSELTNATVIFTNEHEEPTPSDT